MRAVESFVAGRWAAGADGRPVHDAVTGAVIASVSSAGIDLGVAHTHGRAVAGPALRELTFHERAAILRAVGKMVLADTDELYALSYSTGATRSDSSIDIDGGAGALLAYSGIGRRELPNQKVWIDGVVQGLSRDGSFVGQHIITPRHGVALQINAFNFPMWGMLEKFASAFLAGVPSIVKPATPTAYVTEAVVRKIIDSDLLPEGALQFVAGSIDGLIDVLDEQDTLSFTGSAATARVLRGNAAVLDRGVRFSAETDSLNAAVLAPAAGPDTPEFGLFLDEVISEMTVKAGQKCTAIRRVIVPAAHADAVEEALVERMRDITVGDPSAPDTDMGALVGISQRGGREGPQSGRVGGTTVLDTCQFEGVDPERGAFMAPTLLRADDARHQPCSRRRTLRTGCDPDELTQRSMRRLGLVAKGRGSLVASVYGPDLDEAAAVTLGIAPHHGRVHTIDASSAAALDRPWVAVAASSCMVAPVGPGAGEELGGLRSVLHYMQRTAVQGSPDPAHHRHRHVGRRCRPSSEKGHPFTLHFDELEVGDCPRHRTSGDHPRRHRALRPTSTGDLFYAHMDEEAAKASPIFEGRVAHGYLVVVDGGWPVRLARPWTGARQLRGRQPPIRKHRPIPAPKFG